LFVFVLVLVLAPVLIQAFIARLALVRLDRVTDLFGGRILLGAGTVGDVIGALGAAIRERRGALLASTPRLLIRAPYASVIASNPIPNSSRAAQNSRSMNYVESGSRRYSVRFHNHKIATLVLHTPKLLKCHLTN
jgi:hypothetical protein